MTWAQVECHDAHVADESDDRADEREVLTNLPRPSGTSEHAPHDRRIRSEAQALSGQAEAQAEAQGDRGGRAAPPPPPLPPAPTREAHRSPLADVAVAGIELTGALFHFGISLTRAVLSATLGRVPRP